MEVADYRRLSGSSIHRSDSTVSIGAFRPSLVWLFNHIRRDEADSLSKEDLQGLLGSTVDSTQLDEAFDRLDLDKDGAISLDEFLAGFATFWKEAPHTPGFEPLPNFSFNQVLPSTVMEVHYESNTGSHEPSQRLNDCLATLSSHNRHSIEHLWSSLSEQNPNLLNDFEEFVAEVASEVQVAQRALDNQRQAIKREAHELDREMESRLSDAQTTLTVKTNQVKEQVRAKLEERLSEKEGELMFIRSQLSELSNRLDACTSLTLQLEEEVTDTQKQHSELLSEIQALNQEKSELHERLAESEKLLSESQSTVATIQSKALQEVEVQQVYLHHHEEELIKQKKEYETSIVQLKEQLSKYTTQPVQPVRPSNQVTPDLLATSQPRIPGSLRDEIVQKEGTSSPLLGKEPLSPFRGRTHTVVSRPARKERSSSSNLKKSSGLTMSLPNLLDIDDLDTLPQSKQPVFIPVYVGANDHSESEHRLISKTTSLNVVQDTSSDEQGRPTVVKDTPSDVQASPTLVKDTPSDVRGRPSIIQANSSSTIVDQAPTPNPTSDRLMKQSASLPPPQALVVHNSNSAEWQKHYQPIEFIPALRDSPDYVFRILVVGDTFVGKSSYLDRMCNNTFSQHFSSTVGVDFHSKALWTEDKKIVSLQLWDTAGQERFQSVTRSYYRGANGVILMYDVSQESTFLSVKTWLNAIHNHSGPKPPSAVILVGNKIDLEETSQRAVLAETGENFAKMCGAEFIETSAKTGYNVANSLLMLVRAIKDSVDAESEGGVPSKDGRNVEQFQLVDQTPSSASPTETKSTGCCSRT